MSRVSCTSPFRHWPAQLMPARSAGRMALRPTSTIHRRAMGVSLPQWLREIQGNGPVLPVFLQRKAEFHVEKRVFTRRSIRLWRWGDPSGIFWTITYFYGGLRGRHGAIMQSEPPRASPPWLSATESPAPAHRLGPRIAFEGVLGSDKISICTYCIIRAKLLP